MKNRAYLLMTVLFGILSFSLSDARIMNLNAGETIGTPFWSVTIPVKNEPSIAQRVANKYADDFTQLNTKKANDQSTRTPSKFPPGSTNQGTKQGKTPSGEQGAIFDRWGNQ